METFTDPKRLTENPHYKKQRKNTLANLTDGMIDVPIMEIVRGLNNLPCCFTLQSCYGHFLYNGQRETQNLDALPITNTIIRVEYRIAYIAFGIENSDSGRCLFKALKELTIIDPENIQFCCAEWFWKKQVNSYALQVEPDRFKHEDTAILDYKEALNIEKIRNEFFVQLNELLKNQQYLSGPG